MAPNPLRFVLLTALACFASTASAQAPPEEPVAIPPEAPQPTTQPASQPSAEQVQQQMMGMLSDNPQFDAPQPIESAPVEAPPISVLSQVDTAILGIPPGSPQPKLRREGEFIVNRRGRLTRTPSGQVLFVFEADSDAAPEPPMPLLPCQILESMEDLSAQNTDQVAFIVSGQVMLYRGVNFLMPTMMKLSIDRGNLQN